MKADKIMTALVIYLTPNLFLAILGASTVNVITRVESWERREKEKA